MVGQLPPDLGTVAGSEKIVCYTSDGLPKTVTTDQLSSHAPAATPYILQWAIWFNATPSPNELLALYVSPVAYSYPADFTNSVAAAPLTNPSATFVLRVQQQTGGVGSWTDIGTITVNTDGTYAFASVGPVVVAIGDRLRVLGPAIGDGTITGFAATLKGYPLT